MLSNGEEISDMLIVNKDRLFLGKGIYIFQLFVYIFLSFSLFTFFRKPRSSKRIK